MLFDGQLFTDVSEGFSTPIFMAKQADFLEHTEDRGRMLL
jgi:hypothetical protein